MLTYKPRRKPERLTEEQQQLAAEAWGHVAAMAAEAERRYPATCASAEVACRIVRLIPTFNPDKKSLRSWAFMQALGAIKDAQRDSLPAGGKRGRLIPKTGSLAAMVLDPTAVCDPPARWEEDEAARRWVRGLRPEERAAVLDSIVGEEPLSAIGERHGVSESRVSQLRTAAMEQIRYARSAEYAAWAGRESA